MAPCLSRSSLQNSRSGELASCAGLGCRAQPAPLARPLSEGCVSSSLPARPAQAECHSSSELASFSAPVWRACLLSSLAGLAQHELPSLPPALGTHPAPLLVPLVTPPCPGRSLAQCLFPGFPGARAGGLTCHCFLLGAQGERQQPEDATVAGHEVTQKGRAQNTPKGRVRCAPVVQPVPAEEPTNPQARQRQPPGAVAEAGSGGRA